MAYIPDIIDLRPFYIQTVSDETARDTTEWGLVPKKNPYPLLPKAKQPYRNEWADENGDDEYTEEMRYEAMEISVEFYIKAYDTEAASCHELIRNQMDDFFALIRNGEFMIFDSYTGLGRKGVRYAGFNAESFKRRYKTGSNWASGIFTINFKINDPITRVVLENGVLIEY